MEMAKCENCGLRVFDSQMICPRCKSSIGTASAASRTQEGDGFEDEVSTSLKQVGSWVYVGKTHAQKHRLYGRGGLLLFLFFGLVVAPFISVLSYLIPSGGLSQIGDTYIGIVLLHLICLIYFSIWSWILAYKLIRLHKNFHHRAKLYFFAIIFYSSFILSISGHAIRASGSQFLIGFVIANFWPALWLGYVLYSKRINVTYGYRVHHADPFLEELGVPVEQPTISTKTTANSTDGAFELGKTAKKLGKYFEGGPANKHSPLNRPADRFSDRITALNNALREDLISQEEFDEKKKEILKDL